MTTREELLQRKIESPERCEYGKCPFEISGLEIKNLSPHQEPCAHCYLTIGKQITAPLPGYVRTDDIKKDATP